MADKFDVITPPTGRVILDGTSYSGADIKALVHVYGNDQREKEIEFLDGQRRVLVAQRATASAALIPILDTQINALFQAMDDLRSQKKVAFTKELAELQTISVSTYREKYPVRAISTAYPKGFTRGPRTIAGSMVFTVFDKNVLYELLEADPTEFDSDKASTTALIDQMPPFDITLSFANELGQRSRMTLYGVEFVSEGQVMSINDIFVENTVQYVCRDIDPMTKEGDFRQKVVTPGTKLASDLSKEGPAQDYIRNNDPFARFKDRNDPFK